MSILVFITAFKQQASTVVFLCIFYVQ